MCNKYYKSKFSTMIIVLLFCTFFFTLVSNESFAVTSISKCTIKTGYSKTVYTGNTKRPSVKVYKNGKRLKQNRDYKVSYRNNVNPGNATIIITGVGSYRGTVIKSLRINVKAPDNFSAKVIGNSVQLKWEKSKGQKKFLVNARYDNRSRYKNDVKIKSNSYKFTNLPQNKKITFYVSAIGGSKNTKSSVKKITVTTKGIIKTLKAPTLKAESNGYRRNDLTWNPIEWASGYYIYEYNGATGSESIITLSGGSKTSYSFYDKAVGGKYTYKVQAYTTQTGEKIKSSWSKPTTVTAKSTTIGQAASNRDGYRDGDTTGKEIARSSWSYSSSSKRADNWTYVVRFKDSKKAEEAASTMEDICDNNYIGYDNRTYKYCISLFNAAKGNNWNCATINKYVTTACSNAIAVCVYATGERCSCKDGAIASANALGLYKYLSTMDCFEIYSSSKYVANDAYLERGDILITCHSNGKYNHAVMVL